MSLIRHRRQLIERALAVAIGAQRACLAAVVTGPLRKCVVIDFVNTLRAGRSANRCDLLVFRLRNIHEVTWMLTESFTDRGLVFASEGD
jgi:hypothetical protein